MESIQNGDNTGRILKYDPRTGKVTTLLKGPSFPVFHKSFLLVAEPGNLRLLLL